MSNSRDNEYLEIVDQSIWEHGEKNHTKNISLKIVKKKVKKYFFLLNLYDFTFLHNILKCSLIYSNIYFTGMFRVQPKGKVYIKVPRSIYKGKWKGFLLVDAEQCCNCDWIDCFCRIEIDNYISRVY